MIFTGVLFTHLEVVLVEVGAVLCLEEFTESYYNFIYEHVKLRHFGIHLPNCLHIHFIFIFQLLTLIVLSLCLFRSHIWRILCIVQLLFKWLYPGAHCLILFLCQNILPITFSNHIINLFNLCLQIFLLVRIRFIQSIHVLLQVIILNLTLL